MSVANSSARVSHTATNAPLLASQKSQGKAVKPAASVEPLASQKHSGKAIKKAASLAGQKSQMLASQKTEEKAVQVKAPQGNGQKSKTVKVNGLTFRVRLSDRGYRVMLLTVEAGRQREPYLASLRRSEWQAVEHDKPALLAKVREKLCQRIEKAAEDEKGKLQTLFAMISA